MVRQRDRWRNKLFLRIIDPEILGVSFVGENRSAGFAELEARLPGLVRVGREEQEHRDHQENREGDSDHCGHGYWINNLQKQKIVKFSTF